MDDDKLEIWEYWSSSNPLDNFIKIIPKKLDTGKARNMAEDDFAGTKEDFGVPQGGPYSGVPYWIELLRGGGSGLHGSEDGGVKDEPDGNVAPEKPEQRPRYGDPDSCQCGSEATHGENAAHSTWCAKYKESR